MDVLKAPDCHTLEKIKIELGVDDEKFPKQVELFREWLESEPHLPKKVDTLLIENFIRMFDCDLKKAKGRFEKFLVVNAQLKFKTSPCDEDFYDKYAIHRDFILLPHFTSKGYRIAVTRFEEHPARFDFATWFVYVNTMIKYMFHEDTYSGLITVLDFGNINGDHLAKINYRTFLEVGRLTANCYPLKIIAVHFINTSIIAHGIANVFKNIVADIPLSITVHQNPKKLEDFLSSLLPVESKIDNDSLCKWGDNAKEFFVNNKDLQEKLKNHQFASHVPFSSSYFYSEEDLRPGGSFENLVFD